jgi:replicative superfamily II helicase
LRANEFPYGAYPFDEFNPLQRLVLPELESGTNVIVEGKTSSGKTICGEILSATALFQGRQVLYLCPLKALAEEKLEEWTSPTHPWYAHNIAIITGDYVLTPSKKRELENADVIISTFEMFSVRCRMSLSEGSSWLFNLGSLIIDEAHFLSSDGRGDHLEHALLLFTKINPNCRIVFLSATLSNSPDIAIWLTQLNLRPTVHIKSDYRPCPLRIHFHAYEPSGNPFTSSGPDLQRQLKYLFSLDTESQWLVFVHSKAHGRLAIEVAKKVWASRVGFHNADLDKGSRKALEGAFKSGEVRCLIATSTLAYGCNMPARRVAIFGLRRGFSEVDPLDIIQECGRAGRPRYDNEGDAYVILEKRQLQDGWDHLIREGIGVKSRLSTKIGFHLIGEIAEGRIAERDQVVAWAKRSLAYQQELICEKKLTEALTLYRTHGLVHTSFEGPDKFEASILGRIASAHYYDPMDVVSWRRNLNTVNERQLHRNDAALAWMFMRISSIVGFIPKDLKGYVSSYLSEMKKLDLTFGTDGTLAAATVLHLHLTGQVETAKRFPSILISIITDIDRMLSCIQQIDQRIFHNHSQEYFKLLRQRVRYGVNWEEADLCCIPGIGKVHSGALVESGILDQKSFWANPGKVKTVIPYKLYDKLFTKVEA